MADLKLKPCPFCGAEARLVYVGARYATVYIECSRCNVMMGRRYRSISSSHGKEYFESPEEAAEAWNRRANDD